MKLVLFLFCFFSAHAFAGEQFFSRNYIISCVGSAARTYYHNPDIMLAIAKTESKFNPYARNYNRNGTVDIGLMQINTSWIPVLEQYGIKEKDLWNPCINAKVGAWILWNNKKKYGNTWNAVGAYNAHAIDNRRKYVRLVWRNYSLIKGTKN